MSYENIDKTFDSFFRLHKNFLTAFNENPSKTIYNLWSQYFDSDNYCSVKFKSCRSHLHPCKMCFTLSRYFDLATNKPFLIECGKRTSDRFVVRSKPNTFWIHICNEYIQCDPFTCEILIRLSIQEKYEAVGTIVAPFKCNNGAYILEEFCATFDQIEYIDTDGILDLLEQCISLLAWLNGHKFSHTALDAYHILIHDTDVGFAVDGNSSMKVGKYVVCSSTALGLSNCSEINEKVVDNIRTFKMSHRVYNDRRCGKNIYGVCLDLYTLIIGLMCHRDVYKVVMAQYARFWRNLWVLIEDHNKITQWILSRFDRPLPRIQEMIDILDGSLLRVDAIDIASNVFTHPGT